MLKWGSLACLACAIMLSGAHDVEAASNQSEIAIVKELKSFIAEEVTKDAFSGTVLIAKGEEILHQSAHGMASKRFQVPVNLETKFKIASMNKMLTATAVMQLVEKGKVNLEDTLDKYADETWLPKAVTSQIEVQHLLTHAPGLGSYFTEDFFNGSKTLFRKIEDFKPLVAGDTSEFTPGTGFKYSNNGMLLLGVVIEGASGQNYFDYIREHIYAPTGMKNSDCYELDKPVPNLAIGYHKDEKSEYGWINNLQLVPIKGGPAGGCYSTVGDMHRFATNLLSYKLLNKDNTHLMFTAKSEFHTHSYGFGFVDGGTKGNRIVGHRGGFVGMSANLDMFLDKGYIAVVLSNYSGGVHMVVDKIRELIANKP